uniref:Uncharacterized protein n=1 Tax=Arundo donax TaxID=35708 RepID=A0A0A9BHN1_ARUDO
MVQQQNRLHSCGLVPLDAHSRPWSFSYPVFVGSINR